MTSSLKDEVVIEWMEDYTNLPLGTQVGLWKVQVCPHCQRHGLEVISNGATSYKHATYNGRNQEGDPMTGWVFCPDGPPVRTGLPEEIFD